MTWLYLFHLTLAGKQKPASHTPHVLSRRWKNCLLRLPQIGVQRGEHRVLDGLRGLPDAHLPGGAALQGQQHLRGVCQKRSSQRGNRPSPVRFRKSAVLVLTLAAPVWLQINLDFHTKNAIVQNLHEPNVNMFLAAQRKVYSLMDNNSYPRFIHSDLYRELYNTAKRESRLIRP